MAYKRILDIRKIAWNKAEVEYFNMKMNRHETARRRIIYTPQHETMEGYIRWEGKKKDVSALLR